MSKLACSMAPFSLLAVALLLATSSAAAPTRAPVPEENPSTKSVFVDRPDFGRDPFFPTSVRRGKVVPATTTPVVEPVANFGNLFLKGVSGTAEKRLAIINNKTFEIGEEADLRVGGQLIKIKCLEIRDRSVVISVNGVSKELFLGNRL
jgi:hypothetical protein